ncbi:MAG: InlB B-repeat-containing protein [Candidatus Coproplasma sp.]
MQDYGKALRILRRHHNLTQKELAKKLNVTSQTVSKWENGVNQIDITYLRDITALFAISIDDFLLLADGQPLELVLNGSTIVTESDAQTVETTPSLQTNSSPDQAVTSPDQAVTSPDQAVTLVNAGVVPATENSGSSTVNSAVNPHISLGERAKTFIKGNLPGVVSAIVMFFIVVALIITAICVTNPTLSANQIYEKVNPSVFYIEVDTAEGKQAGSGFFIDNKGTAVTNYHVVKGGVNAKVTLPDGNTYDVESIIGCDSVRDLVLLKVGIDRSVPVQQGNSDSLKTGDKVYAIGYPESFILGSQDSTFTDGIISKPSYNIDGVNYIQTTVDVTHGNSGGVLINSEGKVVGITTAKIDIDGVSYMNLALPVNNIGKIGSDVNLPLQDFSNIYRDVTVTYMAGDDVHSQKTVANGTPAPEESGERYGYTFEGWFKDSELTTPFDFDAPVDGDTTIYGKWTELPYYTVTYAFGNEVYTTAKLYEGEKVSKINYSLSGHTFEGWYSDPELTTPFDFSRDINGDITLYGKLKVNTYYIEFMADGGSGEMVRLVAEYGQSIKLPANQFERTGYKFKYWNYNDWLYIYDGDSVKNLTTKDGKTVCLTAVWEIISCRVEYIVEGYTNKIKYVNWGEDVPQYEATKSGYHVEKWYGDEACTIPYVFGKAEQEAITLYANWTANTYYIEFNANGGSGQMERQTVKYDEFDYLDANKYTQKGYKFKYWTYNDNIYNDQNSIYCLADEQGAVVTMTAVWEPIKYKVEYNGYTGGYYWVDLIEYSYEDTVTFIDNEITTATAYFLGWEYNGNVYPAGYKTSKLTSVDGEILEVEAAVRKVKFQDPAGESHYSSSTTSISFTADSVSYSITAPTLGSNTFLGWKYKDTMYLCTDTITGLTTDDRDVTLVSQWSVMSHTNYFIETLSSGEQVTTYTLINGFCGDIKLPTPKYEREGYTFVGWKSRTGTTVYSPGTTLTSFMIGSVSEFYYEAVYESTTSTLSSVDEGTSTADVTVFSEGVSGSEYAQLNTAYFAVSADICADECVLTTRKSYAEGTV